MKASNCYRRDNCPLYELPTESSLGVQSILKSLTLIQHSLDIQNPMWKLVGLKLRISEVRQTLLFLSHKIHLILGVTMVVLPSLYVIWGTRSGTCRVFVYILLHEIPWEYRAVLYIVEKVFSKGSQHCWNREKRFSIHRSEEHTSELQSPDHLVCRLLLEKKKKKKKIDKHNLLSSNTRISTYQH